MSEGRTAEMSEEMGRAFLRMLDELHARHLVGVGGVREVWLIRHADAYSDLHQPGTDFDARLADPSLSRLGREQARALARRLAPIRFDAVWSSGLRRADQTATALARGRELEVRRDDRFREVRTWWDEGVYRPLDDGEAYPFPEPEHEVAGRMEAAIRDVAEALEGGPPAPARAAVVSHNAAISIAASTLLGLRWGQLRIMPHFTSVTVVAAKDGRLVVRSLADSTHLAEVAPAGDEEG